MLTVTDTGIGMDAETQARIFEPFFTTKEPGRGTGLGLATVYGIVRRAGGSIWVYSEPGRGTVFRIYLPQAEGEMETAETARPAETSPAVVPSGTETILLVEDEEALRALARELLESLGYTVLDARHGAEALELSAAHVGRIDLLMTDQVMPHIDGQELATRLAAARPETRVLFVSGYAEDDTTREKPAGEPRGVPAEALHGGGPRDEDPPAPGPALVSPKLQSLTVFLLKPDVGLPTTALRAPRKLTRHGLRRTLPFKGSLWVRGEKPKEPEWVDFLRPGILDDVTVRTASSSAILFVEASDRFFAVAFGYGRSLLKPNAFVRDFGLKAALNALKPESIRSVDVRTFETPITLHTRRQANRGSALNVFGLNVSQDLVGAVAGEPRETDPASSAWREDGAVRAGRARALVSLPRPSS